MSLWLVPPEPAATQLKRLMRVPPSLDPLPYTLPSFEPHITLSIFPASTPFESLRSALDNAERAHANPLRVQFTGLGMGDTFSRSVVIDVEPTPDLHSLRERVQGALPEYRARSPRFPHISLFYVSDEHAVDRERIWEALWAAYGVRLKDSQDERIAFDLAGSTGRHRLEGFEGAEIWIVRCEGPVEDWKVLDKTKLCNESD